MEVSSEKNPELIECLEQFVKYIYQRADKIEGVAIATLENNNISTAYYNLTNGDKVLVGGFITQDATMDRVMDLLGDLFTDSE